MDVEGIKYNIAASTMIHQSCDSVDVLVIAYNDGLKSLASIYVPLRANTVLQRSDWPWYTADLHQVKHLTDTDLCINDKHLE